MHDIDLSTTPSGESRDCNVLVITVGIADITNLPGSVVETRLRKVRGQFRRVIPKATKLLVFSDTSRSDVSIESIIRL